MDTRDKLYLVLLGIVIELAILVHLTFAAERFSFFAVTGDSVKLAWSANTEPDLAAYTLYTAANAEIERLSAELAPLGLPAPFIARPAAE